MSITQVPAITVPSVVNIDGTIHSFDAPSATHAGLVLPTRWQDVNVQMNAILTKQPSRIDELKGLSQNFISPDDIRSALSALGEYLRKNISLPNHEMTRLKGLYSHMFDTSEVTKRVNDIKDATEWNKDPLIIALPTCISIDNQ